MVILQVSDGIRFREGTQADRDPILSLRVLLFPRDDVEKALSGFWEWEFVHGYAGPGRIFVAEGPEGIVGHFAFVPQTYRGSGLVRGALAVDVMTHPGYQRRGIFSRLAAFAADQLRTEFEVITAFQIRQQVLPGMLAGGWRVSQKVPVLLKPLSMARLARDLAFGSRSLPVVPSEGGSEESIRSLSLPDLDQVDALLVTNAMRQPRTPEFLQWRYFRNPHWQYQIDGFFERGKLCAFLVHRAASLRGLGSLAIADAGSEAGSEAALTSLISHTCKRGARAGLGVAAALLSRNHPAYGVVRKSGFFPGPHRFALMVQEFGRRDPASASGRWSLSWGDTDHI